MVYVTSSLQSVIAAGRLQSQIGNGLIFGKKIYQIPNFQNGLKGRSINIKYLIQMREDMP